MLEPGAQNDRTDPPRPNRGGRGLGGLFLRLAIVLVVATALVLISKPDGDGPVSAKVVGPEQTVFKWARDACDPRHLPDAPARAFRDASGQVQLIAASAVNRRMIGPDLNHVRNSCDVVMPSNREADPAAFNDDEWIAALYTTDGRTVHALVHNEYHGDEHPGRCRGKWPTCWYNSITLATSRDQGRTYHQAPAPALLVASLPYRYEPDQQPYGLFQPSNIVRNPDDGYYYVLIRASASGDQKQGTCIARTRDLSRADSWRAWDGNSFDVQFANPYTNSANPPSAHVCAPLQPANLLGMSQSLTYSTYLDKFVLLGTTLYPRNRKLGAIFFTTSKDLLHWSAPQLLASVELVYTWQCGDKQPVLHTSLLDPKSKSRNFETIGREPYMYFTRFHYHGCFQTFNRDLIRVRVKFSK